MNDDALLALKEELKELRQELNDLRHTVMGLCSDIAELKGRVHELSGRNQLLIILVKYVVTPLLLIVGALVGIQLTLL